MAKNKEQEIRQLRQQIADWIINFFPDHHSYLEPYFGSGGQLNPNWVMESLKARIRKIRKENRK